MQVSGRNISRSGTFVPVVGSTLCRTARPVPVTAFVGKPPRSVPKEPFATSRVSAGVGRRAVPQSDKDTVASPECLDLPRHRALLRRRGWHTAESFGLPTAGYAIAAPVAGRDAGRWCML